MKHTMLLVTKQLLIALTCLLAMLATPVLAEDEAAPVTPVYIELKPDFIVNYAAEGNRLHYIKTKISLRTDSARENIILSNMPVIRDALVMFLSSRTADQVTGAVAREKTREEAKVAINEALQEETGTEPVMDVLFASFVTQ